MKYFRDKSLNCNCPMGCSSKNGGCMKKWNFSPQDIFRNNRPKREETAKVAIAVEAKEWWG